MRATDLSRHQLEYQRDGLTVLEELVPPGLVAEWVGCALELAQRGVVHDEVLEPDASVGDRGGRYLHTILDGLVTAQELPGLMGWYAANVTLMAAVTGEDAILSPYPRSAVNVKLYPSPGGQQGWHYDSNTLTGLLFLTTEVGEGAFHYRNLQGIEGRVYPKAGALLIGQGRRVEHAVEPMVSKDGRVRITVPLNYYTVTDTARPEGLDDRIYGPVAAAGQEASAFKPARHWCGG